MKYKGLLIIPALIAAITASLVTLSAVEGSAKENVGMSGGKVTPPTINAACLSSTVQSDLAVNNVRTRILLGDMWWDLAAGVYEIPKGGGLHSIFAGALWVGGVDAGGQLKVAAQTYRQTGNDFWPGPLQIADASVDPAVCAAYDKHFKITRKEVETFVSTGATTPAILNWPGNGGLGQAQYLAPFFDKNADGLYTPSAGDYPGYDLVSGDGYGECQKVNCIPVDQLFGDETLWWVFNDKGNIHGETGGQPIGLEIRAQAFGFFTDDEINDMTFYNYRIFNRSTFQVNSCYFGVFCDADLGEYTDDYVGCDVKRGLGYTYNGDNYDEPPAGYGDNPPAIGIDFFQGPIADTGDTKDNDRNCQTDEPCEQIIMSGFLYYDNINNVPYGNPTGASHFYNYLRMKWGDEQPVQYGGNGYQTGGAVCNFMFPGYPASTDEHDWGIGGNCSTSPTLPGWDEVSAGNLVNDRRMIESAGPFTLLPGAVNVITTGVVWAKASSGGAQASVKKLQKVDDKAQALFDNCFKVLDGPNAPDITIQELDKELILYLSNTDPGSNNYNETYTEFDPLISLLDSTSTSCPIVDKYYHFEGYKIFQIKNQTISGGDLDDIDKARLIYQCDVKNGVSSIINYEFDQALGAATPKLKVEGADAGISHSIRIIQDAFASGSSTLINHKTYYFMAIAYGYNQYKKYQTDIPPTNATMCDATAGAITGQKKPYKQGRKNIVAYSGIPHMPTHETGGTQTDGEYGDTRIITRVEGNGNGGANLDLSSTTITEILSSSDYRAKTLEYENGSGPLNVKVVDPLNVPDATSFTFKMIDPVLTPVPNLSDAYWTLTSNTGDVVTSDKTINLIDEKLILKWGLSITIGQVADPGASAAVDNGFLSATMTFSDIDKNWLSAVVDQDGDFYTNWIRSGTSDALDPDPWKDDYVGIDNDQNYEGALGGTWAPYRLTSYSDVVLPSKPFNPKNYHMGPSLTANHNAPLMKDLASVNVVLTADKSLWTRCVVLEMCEDSMYSANSAGLTKKARKQDFRRALSVDKNGSTAIGSDNNDFVTGMGWFPGYAINLETGERLNIAFGENSALTQIAGKAVINYNYRATLMYGSLYGGPFKAFPNGETITDFNGTPTTPDATAVVFYDNGSDSMIVQSMSQIISPSDIIVGGTSGAKAIVSSFTTNTFQLGETITGGTSLATGVIVKDMSSTDVMLINTLTGTFAAGEEITGGASGAVAVITTYSPYNFQHNGADMVWNPTSSTYSTVPWAAGASNPVFGGQHYIYVFGHNRDDDTTSSPTPNDIKNVPRYDKGKRIRELLDLNNGLPSVNDQKEVFRDAMWVNIPLLASGHSLLESDVTIKLRVAKPYKPGYSAAWFQDGLNIIYSDTAATAFGQNKNLPMYTFNTEGIAVHEGEADLAKEALDNIRVVPNPYYAYSSYETGQLDNRVKITNLPEKCTVSIYNLGGTLIKKYKKGQALTNHDAFSSVVSTAAGAVVVTTNDGSLDWDLKNTAGIPISSGVYIVHVEVPDVGEKVIKWFGIMRPVDLDSF